MQVGIWEPHGELAWGALEGSPGSISVGALPGGLLCLFPHRGTWNTTQLGACTHGKHAYMWVHTLGELLDHAYPEPGLLVSWSLPCASHVWGLEGCKDDGSSCIYGFGHGTAWPCSICGHQGWGPNQQGQRLPGSTPAFPRGPKFLPWGPPLPSVCVEGGFASSPPLLRYFGAVCPALVSAATVEGVEAMYNRTGGVLWVLPCVLLWVPPSQGRQEDCGRQFWPRLQPASWTVAVRAVLGTEHPLNHVQSGGGTAGAQHPGLGAWQGVRARCKRAATGRGVRAGPATLPGLCWAATPRDEPLWAIPGQGEDGFTMDWGRGRGRQ